MTRFQELPGSDTVVDLDAIAAIEGGHYERASGGERFAARVKVHLHSGAFVTVAPCAELFLHDAAARTFSRDWARLFGAALASGDEIEFGRTIPGHPAYMPDAALVSDLELELEQVRTMLDAERDRSDALQVKLDAAAIHTDGLRAQLTGVATELDAERIKVDELQAQLDARPAKKAAAKKAPAKRKAADK